MPIDALDPRANQETLRNIRSIYVKDFEAKVENDTITEFRINAKISFDLESERST